MTWSRRTFLSFVCIAFLGMQMAGVHLHLCFDGTEAPEALHLTNDMVAEQVHHMDGLQHNDVDIFVSNDGIHKKSPQTDFIFLPVLLSIVALLLSSPRSFTPFPPGVVHFRRVFAFASPPLRAPPR